MFKVKTREIVPFEYIFSPPFRTPKFMKLIRYFTVLTYWDSCSYKGRSVKIPMYESSSIQRYRLCVILFHHPQNCTLPDLPPIVCCTVQCCGAESICFDSGSTEPQIRIAAPAQAPAPAPGSFMRWIENYLFWRNRIKIVTILKKFFSNQVFFYKIERSRRKEFVILAPGGNLIQFPVSRLRLHNKILDQPESLSSIGRAVSEISRFKMPLSKRKITDNILRDAIF